MTVFRNLIRRRKRLSFAAGLVLMLGCSASRPAEERTEKSQEKPPEFVSLFDGKTLKGWHRHDGLPGDNLGGKWEVVDGAIEGDQDPPGKGGLLVTDRNFKDFVLKLEAKIDFPVDSGIFLRVGPTGRSHQITLDNREGGSIGSIYLPWTQGMVFENKTGFDFFKSGEWNQLEIAMQGEPARIQFWVNGHLVTDFQHTAETTKGNPKTGGIALQVHPGGEWIPGNKASFRNIRIQEL